MKVLYTASVLSHICQFHLPMMEGFQKQGWEVHVAARDNLAEKNGLQLHHCDHFFDVPFQRSPKDKRNLDALKRLKKLLAEEYYDLIICNTPVCGILTRIAARKARKKGTKVIYFAHGFHFYKNAPRKYWLVYPIEKFFADHDTDMLITINEEDDRIARKKFRCGVAHLHGVGVSPEKFHPVSDEERMTLRRANGFRDDECVILCTGELIPNKNQRTLISAIAESAERFPNLRLLLAGNGCEEQNLKEHIRCLHVEDRVELLGYRTDLDRLLPAVDIVASCSIREGLGLNVVEGMLCAKPIIASKNRGHCELVTDEETGYLIDTFDIKGFSDRICELAVDGEKRKRMGASGIEKAQKYTLKTVAAEFDEVIRKVTGQRAGKV